MFKRVTVLLVSAGCCLALYATLHAINFAVDFKGTNAFDPEFQLPLVHNRTIEFVQFAADETEEG